jgi:hypothetical protein
VVTFRGYTPGGLFEATENYDSDANEHQEENGRKDERPGKDSVH